MMVVTQKNSDFPTCGLLGSMMREEKKSCAFSFLEFFPRSAALLVGLKIKVLVKHIGYKTRVYGEHQRPCEFNRQ